MEIVALNWSGRHAFSDTGLDSDAQLLDWNVGIYMITDAQRGPNGWIHRRPPLYIGKVDGTTFRQELRRHLKDEVGECVCQNCRYTIL